MWQSVGHREAPWLACVARRYLSVLSWGRNLEGQCGVEGRALVTKPTLVLELIDASPEQIVAGERTSAAVSANGDIYTWGDGWGGKLGHGSGDSTGAPSRVESLVGRASVGHVALGDHHTLMCDRQGTVWACGENKEGQCGLGTPREALVQHISGIHPSLRLSRVSPPPGQPATAALQQHAAAAAAHIQGGTHAHHHHNTHPWASVSQQSHRRDRNRDAVQDWVRSAMHKGRSGRRRHVPTWPRPHTPGVDTDMGMLGPLSALLGDAPGRSHTPSSAFTGTPVGALTWGGTDLAAQLTARGAQPSHHPTPTRVGRDIHPLAQAALGTDTWNGAQAAISAEWPTHSIYGDRIVGVSARRHYSVAWDSKGRVWTWGACFGGCLGPHHTWVTSPQLVDGDLGQLLESEGGVIHASAGGSFVIALTASGKAVLWGTWPDPLTEDMTTHDYINSPLGTAHTSAARQTGRDTAKSAAAAGVAAAAAEPAATAAAAAGAAAADAQASASMQGVPPQGLSRPPTAEPEAASSTNTTTTPTATGTAGSQASPHIKPSSSSDTSSTLTNTTTTASATGTAGSQASQSSGLGTSQRPTEAPNPTASSQSTGVANRDRKRINNGVVVPGLPQLRHVAAGAKHALVSDGQRVWRIGQGVGTGAGEEWLWSYTAWTHPQEELDLGDSCVRSLRCGSYSSAVVTDGGELWLWGQVMTETHGRLVLKRQAERAHQGHLQGTSARPEACDWGWAGWGGATPRRVSGLWGLVTDVALGGRHVLVMVE